ncbi:Remorin 4.1 [Senna tora]|uniref:Remorin 4.1 n=1 Tax=Senna tora TaxID=362788 RepID=A0A834WFK3_9FABA|nr:Remorin 4.1 [Senna tora]
MPELGFQEGTSSMPGSAPRDTSPDSVIFTLESNFSLFSAASASVDRCSFASDAHDHDSLVSEISLHLAGHDCEFSHNESWSGPDPDPDKHTLHNKKHSRLSRKGETAKVQKHDSDADDGKQLLQLDSTWNSFSLALRGTLPTSYNPKRSRSEAFLKKPDRRRPASLDLNNATGTSPRLGTMRKSSVSSQRSEAFPSPGTPNYRKVGVAMQKGWSSERVPLHTNASRKHVSGTGALLPLNNGRTLPSKWEDAERWILSPVSGDSTERASLPAPQRRPKSKSGPLGPPGAAYSSLYSPAVPMFEVRNAGNFMGASPFSAEVISANGLTIHSNAHAGLLPEQTEPFMARSVSMHGCSEMQSQSSTSSQDAATDVSCAILRRDMATQMSPESSPCSSPNMSTSFSASTPSVLPTTELQGVSSSKMDIRDVQVDERVTMSRWSKKHRALFSGRGSENVDNRKKKETRAHSSSWDMSEKAKTHSRAKREEAKITAWENLQKAKAEAAIRKLEYEFYFQKQWIIIIIILFVILDEVGKEESIFYEQDHEQAEISSKESSGNEKLNFNQRGPSSSKDFPQGSVISQKQPDGLFERCEFMLPSLRFK